MGAKNTGTGVDRTECYELKFAKLLLNHLLADIYFVI